ncbi:MAG: DNRLRE domain-containing protein, partial [Gammaproteobacteria bacterium]
MRQMGEAGMPMWRWTRTQAPQLSATRRPARARPARVVGTGQRVLASCLVAYGCLFSTQVSATTYHVSDDTYTNVATPALVYGTGLGVSVANGTAERRGYMRFNLSGVPAGLTLDQIASARLRLWVKSVSASGRIDLYQITSPWSESSLNAASAPVMDAAPIASFNISAAHARRYIDIDVLPAMTALLLQNHGFALVSAGGRAEFDSKEIQ